MTIGNLLAERARELGLSHAAAAERVGVRQQTFSRWVAGEHYPDEDSVPGVAQFLNISRAKVREVIGTRVRTVSTAQRLDRIEAELGELRKAITRLLARSAEPQ